MAFGPGRVADSRRRGRVVRRCGAEPLRRRRPCRLRAGPRRGECAGQVRAARHVLGCLELMRSNDIERTNDALVDQRRDWLPTRVIAEYERRSQVMLRLIGPVSRTPLARAPMRLAELGRLRVSQLLCAIVFDTHTHLRHDIAPALGRTVPETDADRMAVVLEWMMAVLSNQLHAARPEWLDRPVSITLSGPGGGCWVVGADGSVQFRIAIRHRG